LIVYVYWQLSLCTLIVKKMYAGYNVLLITLFRIGLFGWYVANSHIRWLRSCLAKVVPLASRPTNVFLWFANIVISLWWIIWLGTNYFELRAGILCSLMTECEGLNMKFFYKLLLRIWLGVWQFKSNIRSFITSWMHSSLESKYTNRVAV